VMRLDAVGFHVEVFSGGGMLTGTVGH
jgi:hypothetical protein